MVTTIEVTSLVTTVKDIIDEKFAELKYAGIQTQTAQKVPDKADPPQNDSKTLPNQNDEYQR